MEFFGTLIIAGQSSDGKEAKQLVENAKLCVDLIDSDVGPAVDLSASDNAKPILICSEGSFRGVENIRAFINSRHIN